MTDPTFDDLLRYMHDSNVDAVDFRFTDFNGIWHHITFHQDAISENLLQQGIMFDGSSIPGWRGIEDSDLILKPDYTSLRLDPFTATPTLILFGDVYDPHTNQPYDHDPRSIAKQAEIYLTQTGLANKAYFGPEPEFFIFDEVLVENSPMQSFYALHNDEISAFGPWALDPGIRHKQGHTMVSKGGYVPCGPQDRDRDIRQEMLALLHDLGLGAEKHHHEVAPGQHELGFRYDTLRQTGDHLQLYKYVVHQTAYRHGKTATFMPKPLAGDNGSGMHVHQSLWQDAQSLFAGDVYEGLSETALYYIGGILHHTKAINALTNPTTNSYRRLVPGFEAPVYRSYGARNRSTAIRIPHSPASAKRIEARFPDPMANPYLGLVAMLMAGLDGIQKKIHPGDATELNLYEDCQTYKDKSMASSLDEALTALETGSDFLTIGGVFSPKAIASYIALKRQECQEAQQTPTPWEFKTYYSR